MELIRTPKVANVRMLCRYPGQQLTGGRDTTGTLYLTATHLIFVDHSAKRENWILHTLISSIEKLSITTNGSPLLMRCKHFLCVTFIIPKERDAHDIYLSIYQLSQPTNIEDLYCFNYTASNEHFDKEDGWHQYSVESEFQRMGLPNQHWTQTTINTNYEVCDTYPRSLYCPAGATKQILLGSANFRSKGRLPVLTYLHKNNAVICRCAQPLSGFSARCVEDEQLFNCILKSNPKSSVLYVVDTRPMINAMVNKAQGKGYENEYFYENTKFHFFGIENIHVMRGSLQKLMDACELKVPSMNAFLSGVEGSGWLRHVKSVLETSAFIARAVSDGISVVVHCSDGWDRTAQTCGLAAVILDPYYRTLEGFQALIEKEWLAFGHKFSDRCGHIQGDSKEMAPVFTQFLDAVWQLAGQFPQHFQFNERYLLAIHDHVHSCQFGTFIGNSDRERRELRLAERTYSLWAYTASHRSEFMNPLYVGNSDDDEEEGAIGQHMLNVDVSPQIIKFWRGLYNRFEFGVHPRHSLNEVLVATHNHITSLEDHIDYLEERIAQLTHTDDDDDDTDNGPADHPLATTTNTSTTTSGAYLYKSSDSQSNGNSNFIGSLDLDEIDSPLKVVEECMNRLEMCKTKDITITTNNNNNIKDQQLKQQQREVAAAQAVADTQAVYDTVALQWQSLHSVKECPCGTPFEPFAPKLHCWTCGQLYCVRCIDKRIPLPGHQQQHQHHRHQQHRRHSYCPTINTNYSHNRKQQQQQSVPVCRTCYQLVMRSNSIDCI